MAHCQFLFPFQRKRETRFAQFQQNFTQTRFKTFHILRHLVTQEVARKFCAEKFHLSITVAMPHQSEAPVRGRTGFSKIGGLLASVPSTQLSRGLFAELFFRTRTLATQARFSLTFGDASAYPGSPRFQLLQFSFLYGKHGFG